MLISPKHRALILKLRDPNRVLTVVPTAREIEAGGVRYVAVPHRPDETKVLRNLGIEAPSPILHYYGWPGRYQPFDAQREAAAFLTLHRRAFNLSDLGCVDADTEYLSPTGWVRIADYANGPVAQYWPQTGAVEFVEPSEYVRRPCAEMIRIKTKYGVDQLLSPEHRVLLRDRANPDKQEVVQAAELFDRHARWLGGEKARRSTSRIAYTGAAIPVTFSPAGGAGVPYNEAELRLQVAVMADGHFPGASSRCVVRLKKQRKKLRLRQLLTAAGAQWTEREQNTATAQGYTVFTFHAPNNKKVFDAEFWGASGGQLRVIAEEVLHWGSCMGGGNRGDRFFTHEKASADFIQYAMCATGRTARILSHTRCRRGRSETEYVVQIRNNGRPLQIKGHSSGGVRRRSMWVEPSTDGFKYCFMVPSTFLLFRRNGCVFASGNTGKTLATLWGYDYLREHKILRRALVVTPLSTLERTWADEIFQHFPHLGTVVLYGSRERRLKLLEQDADLYLINHDGLKVSGMVAALNARPDIDLIIIDEIAQVARNAGTERFKALRAIVNHGPPRSAWGLTGTPTPNAPTDAWAQCRLLVPERVPPYYNRFRDAVMRQVSQYVWVQREGALDTVREAMQPAIRFARDECVDLPPRMYESRYAELTPEQARAYKQMLTRLKAEVADGQVLAVNEAVKASKLIQIASGIVYGADGEELTAGAAPRLEVVREAIEEAASKVIVFVPFVSAVPLLLADLRAHGLTAEAIHGGVAKHERDRIFAEFQSGPDLRVLVAQPAAMSHGLTLTAASTIVWYAPITSAEIFEQANARITRPGQRHSQLIVTIEGSEIERRYYKRLKDRQDMQGVLLDLIREDRLTSSVVAC